ncbi:MAG: hypothetical protein VX733_09970 [Candidatus Latescibacterota bacterium]|nr:hypothetical protein [Candidatus Latescibacterota bacterium]
MDGEWVGENVTKDIYIETDGRHAFYAEGQKYAGVDGETILDMVTSEMLHWVKHGDGRTTLDACYDGTWLRRSEDNGGHWQGVGEKAHFDTERTDEQLLPSGMVLDERTTH